MFVGGEVIPNQSVSVFLKGGRGGYLFFVLFDLRTLQIHALKKRSNKIVKSVDPVSVLGL